EDQERLHRAVLARAAEGEVIVPVAVEVTGRDRARRAAERLGAALAVIDGEPAVDGRRLGLVSGLVVAAAVVTDGDVRGAVTVEVAVGARQPFVELSARAFQAVRSGAQQPVGGLLAVVGLPDDQARRLADPADDQRPELVARR